MNNTPKKSNKKSSIMQVSSLDDFIKWVAKIDKKNILFRGLADIEWGGESSLCRELDKNGYKNVASDRFLEETEKSIDFARNNKYDIKEGRECKLEDLELLANLQHNKNINGIDTCLIDFTKYSFIALLFACESLNNKSGRVIAFSRDNTDFSKIDNEEIKKKIRHWLEKYETTKKPWIFFPPPELNNRIISQQSVFVFGSPTISIENFYICKIKAKNKQKILTQLKKNGISKDTLNFPIVHPTQNSYDGDHIYGDIKSIEHYDKVIKANPNDKTAYNNRGIAKSESSNSQGALRDFNEAIKLDLKYSLAYSNRGNVKGSMSEFKEAISDYDTAIELNPKDYKAYYNRGIAKANLGNFQDALSDYDEVIKLNHESYIIYYNRGLAKCYLDRNKDAISDFNEAIRLDSKKWKAYHNRAYAKSKLGDKEGALADFTKAKELSPELDIPDLQSDL